MGEGSTLADRVFIITVLAKVVSFDEKLVTNSESSGALFGR